MMEYGISWMERMSQKLEFAPAEAAKLPPLQLAYIGDTVFDLFVRTYLVETCSGSVHALHQLSSGLVSAAGQAAAYFIIEPVLTEQERDIFRRGRNAHSGTVPKNAKVGDYRMATGLEALMGYLFCIGQEARLDELMEMILKERVHTNVIQQQQ